MINDKRPSLKFFAAGMVGLMIAPFIIIFGPPILFKAMYFNKDHIVYMIPWSNLILFGIAFIAIIINLFLLAWKRNKWMYSVTVVVLFASIIGFIQSTKSYTAIDDSGLILMQYGKETNYLWSDFESIDFYYNSDYDEPGVYKFTLKTGEIVELEEGGQFKKGVRNIIYSLARNHNIYVKEQPKE